MKKLLLLLLISLVTLQPLFAATADFAHVLSSQSTEDKTLDHMIEHFDHVAHHHEDDGDAHEDESQKSFGHMMDFEHGLNLTSIPTAESKIVLSKLESEAPLYLPSIYYNPSHSPPLKPPYPAL
jgi:hypothetical protein